MSMRGVDARAARHERGTDAAKDVDPVLRFDASERPATERHVEGLAFEVERLGAVHAELHLVRLPVREGRPGGRTRSASGSNA
jgi:hypothetical protein